MSQKEELEQTQQELPIEDVEESTPAADPVEVEASSSEEPEAVEEAPEYTPNYKFKSLDDEYEIMPELQGAITNEEVEKKVRELHEKAYGLDHVKGKYERVQGEIAELKPLAEKYHNIDTSLKHLSKCVENNDFDTFFQNLKIPQEAIYGWVQQKIKEMDLPDEDRAQLSQHRETQKRAYLLEQQNQQYEQQNQQYEQQLLQREVEQMTYELDNTLTQPEVKDAAEFYDTRVGKPGAFRDEVLRRGKYEHDTTGREPTIQEVVGNVLEYTRKFMPQQQQTPTQHPQMVSQTEKPVIPNISGKSSSPIKPGVRSLDDLKKLAQSM